MSKSLFKSYISHFYRLFFLLGLTFPGTAYSIDSGKNLCTTADIKSIVVPLRNSSPEKIKLKYQFFRKAKSGFPTVIYLPGGPGGTSIGDQGISLLIPESYGLIQTDPRGAGCNANKLLKFTDVNTEVLAEDILRVTNAEGIPPQEIILFGKSYGTALATTVGFLNSLLGREPFKKIILEGVLGFGSQNQKEYLAGYVSAVKRYFLNRPSLLQKVESSIEKYGVDRKVFAKFLTAYIIEGIMGKGQGHPLDEPLHWMTDGLNFKVFNEEFLIPIQKQNPSGEDANEFVWSAVTCNELSPLNFEFTFLNGDLKIESGSTGHRLTCKNKTIERPYDSKKMQLREEIIYLQGSEDPATSMDQAIYHFDSQKLSKRKDFIVFGGFGHSVLAWLEYRHSGLVKEIWLRNFDPNFISANLPEFQIEFK